ncbi:MAG: type II toxin-antitoxin system HicB family antitoxin [Defluviitaleaceae bacterium]|nr:type II toxin-antitoxin system HicB family antitoxin [Defluviitaleaceae bacterium]
MKNNMLTYKDFLGSVEYSASDECFYGKLIGTTDLVTYEGDNVQGLKIAFREAVEDYLVLCKEVGKIPQKVYKGSFNVRISPDLHKEAALLAVRKGVSLNSLVEKAIYDEVNAS